MNTQQKIYEQIPDKYKEDYLRGYSRQPKENDTSAREKVSDKHFKQISEVSAHDEGFLAGILLKFWRVGK